MPRSLFLSLSLAALVLTTGACTVQRTFIVGQTYQRNPDPASIRLFIGELETPHSEIAYVHSYTAPDKRVSTRREQIDDLQRRAAKVGADALMDVQLLAEEHRGISLNRTTPIRTPRQGEYKRYFLRGTAIRLDGDVDSMEPALNPAPIEDAMLEAIPEMEPEPVAAPTESPRVAY